MSAGKPIGYPGELNGKTALVIGITGQDGSYLAEFLIGKGYLVHGIVRRSSSFNTGRIDHLFEDPTIGESRLFLHFGDLQDQSVISKLVSEVKPDEIYNLGAQSHVKVSFEMPVLTGDITGLGTTRLLEAVKNHSPNSRVYQASSSEMFGASPPPQNEETVFYPRSPYGAAKVYSYWIAKNYREAHNLFVSNGILFNHESPRRGKTFVTRKISTAVARIHLGLQDKLVLGNLDAVRDWGYAPEYVKGMWLMLQAETPDDFVLASGSGHTVQEFAAAAFQSAEIDWREYVEVDPRYLRPTEVDSLIGDTRKASSSFGWTSSVKLEELAKIMVEHDLLEQSNGGTFLPDTPRFG